MYYKYICTCGKELYAEHEPNEVHGTCGEIDPDCKENMGLYREDVYVETIKTYEQLKEEMKHYRTDDQEVLRERIKNHLEQIELEKKKEELKTRKELSPSDILDMFQKAKQDSE